jgi:galactokinase/mevalonate kinase-like predicted kinase
MAICEQTNLERLYTSRERLMQGSLRQLASNPRGPFYQLDLQHTADLLRDAVADPPPAWPEPASPINRMRDRMFQAAVLRCQGRGGFEALEGEAFRILRETIIEAAARDPVVPQRNVLDDQIVWGRSPVRIDLAGGWSDTPPYCLQNGGKVLNLALDINGQPPVQVFARVSTEPVLVLRSIDLGVSQTVRTYSELGSYTDVASGFSLAKAAVALAGFLPRFHGSGGHASLEEQFKAFGGGLDISVLAAVPKGSGLGTSSILAATLLGTLSEVCGLGWDKRDVFHRTLVLEQMLTTGGGWQDQAGGLFRGVKLVSTGVGIVQEPQIRYLPEHLFRGDEVSQRVLLYYTGITRLAKNILEEIVRGMFLNSAPHLSVLNELAAHAETTFDAILSDNWNALCEAVAESWRLNCRLDQGTNPAEVQAIIRRIEDHAAALKLAGAGGGGYMVIFAKDESAGRKIRAELSKQPPNPRARFVDFRVSPSGLQVTRS